jgi:hypothetical protein
MPVVIIANEQVTKLLNLIGANLYPLSLSLLLPIYMYSIVYEKEEKLIQYMQMNGMMMWKYWVTNFIFDFGIYIIMVIIFFLFGYFVIDITYFTKTTWSLQIIIFTGWGLSQIGLAFFWAAFISKAKTASSNFHLFTFITLYSYRVCHCDVYHYYRE